MQTEVQKLWLQNDGETRERIKTAIALSGYAAVRSLMFRIEQGVVDIRGRFPSFYLCQVAIESVKRVPGVVRVINHSEVDYALIPLRESVESDLRESVESNLRESVESNCEVKSGLRSIVVLPLAKTPSPFAVAQQP